LRILTKKQGFKTHKDVFSMCKGGFYCLFCSVYYHILLYSDL